MSIAIIQVRKAIAKGVRIAVGTDAGVYPHLRNAGEFIRLVDLRMTPAQALKRAPAWTRNFSDYWIVRVHWIPASSAGIVAVAGNPLDSITQVEKIRFVMKDGVVWRKE